MQTVYKLTSEEIKKACKIFVGNTIPEIDKLDDSWKVDIKVHPEQKDRPGEGISGYEISANVHK